MNMCSYLAVEIDGLTHWAGYDCDTGAWYRVCDSEVLTHACIKDLPTAPLCSVCLVSSDTEAMA